MHSGKEEAAIRKSRARSLERAEEQLERVRRGLGGRYYPDQKAVERKLAQILQGPPGRFITTTTGKRAGKPTLDFKRNQDAIADAERLDGIYCLITNLTAEQADHAALLAYFKEQERVERGHCTLKGPLRVRPLFVQNDDRITALLAVCCFALMIYTLIERDARRRYPDGLSALGERRTGPATARAVLHLLQDTTLLHAGDSLTIEPPANARELYQRLTA